MTGDREGDRKEAAAAEKFHPKGATEKERPRDNDSCQIESNHSITPFTSSHLCLCAHTVDHRHNR